MIPATHGGLSYGSCPHCAQQPEHCLDHETCALCRCDFCEGRRLPAFRLHPVDRGDLLLAVEPSALVSADGFGLYGMVRKADELHLSTGVAPGSPAGPTNIEIVDGLNNASAEEAGFVGERNPVDSHSSLLLGGAAGLAGGADFRLSDPKGGCQSKDGSAARGCLSVDQPGNGVRSQAGGCAPCGQTALLDDAAEQLSEGLDRLSLCHGETLSGIEEEKLGTLLDILDESDESAQVKNAPDAASLGGSTAPGAEPRS